MRYHTTTPAAIDVLTVDGPAVTRVVTVLLDQPCADMSCQRTHAEYPSPCPVCAGAGHLGPATGADQRDYGRACPRCSERDLSPSPQEGGS